MKKLVYLLVSLSIFLFASCENFMQGGNIKDQLEDMILEANAKSVKIIISQDNTMGTFLSTGEKECKLGYAIDVQFNLKKDSYIYKGLKAVSTADETESRDDCVEFTALESDDQKGIYKVSIKVLKEASDIMIVPDCIMIPGVVKEECFPSFDASGWEQDSTIRIVFNKPVTTTDTFGITITDTAGLSMASYYEEPRFSSDKMTLLIPAIKAKDDSERILDPNGNITTKDLIIKFDLSDIKDEEDNYGSGIFEYKFRLKKQCDTNKPNIGNVSVFSTSDTTKSYYKQISQSNYSEWATETDYIAHHIGGSVYLEFEASDEGTGIFGVTIQERLIKYSDGTNAPETTTDPSYEQEASFNEETGKYYCNYEINNTNDGILLLKVFALDYAQNSSMVSKNYYVLKDTIIDASLFKFDEEISSFDITSTQAWLDNIPDESDIENDIQHVKIHLPTNVKDIYYNNYSSDFKMNVYWGALKDSINTPVTRNGNEFTFYRDVTRTAYIKIECEDNVGNRKEIIKIMDPRAIIDKLSYSPAHEYTDENGITLPVSLETNIEAKNIITMLTQNEKDSSATTGIRLIFDIDGVRKGLERTSYYLAGDWAENWIDEIKFANNSIPPINELVKVYVISFCGDFLSPISKEYVQCKISGYSGPEQDQNSVQFVDGYDPTLITPETNNGGSSGSTSINYELGPYIKNNISIETKPITNSGSYKVTIKNYKTAEGENNQNIKYEFVTIDSFGRVNYSNSPEFMLMSPGKYAFFVNATSSDGNVYKPGQNNLVGRINAALTAAWAGGHGADPTYGDLDVTLIEGIFNFYLNNETETKKLLHFTADLTPPHLKTPEGEFYVCGNSAGFTINPPEGDPMDHGDYDLYKNSNNKYELSYYLIPSPSNKLKTVQTYSLNELENDYFRYGGTLEYSQQGTTLIPFGNIKPGIYNLCVVAKDTSSNYTIITIPVVHRILGHLDFTPGITPTVNISGNVHYDISSYIQQGEYYYWQTYPGPGTPVTLDAECWNRISGYRDFEENSDSTQEIGFYYTEYFYTSTNNATVICNSKNIIDGYNGYQIFCDKPVLAHTMYSPHKLTESTESEDALCIWESRALETGFVHSSSNFTYDKSKYNNVQKGWYYTTIFHFADGTYVMTDIKQKD